MSESKLTKSIYPLEDGPVEEGQVLTPEMLHDVAIRRTSIVSKDGNIVNASGHKDQLQRQYGLLSICGLALNIDNAWIAFGGSLSVAVLNGGPPGILYEFIVACSYYAFIGASIAELASAIPSSGGVYHWGKCLVSIIELGTPPHEIAWNKSIQPLMVRRRMTREGNSDKRGSKS